MSYDQDHKTRQGYAQVSSNWRVPLFLSVMLRPFTKPSLTLRDQVSLLESRGMKIPDKARAEFYLSHINYYRFKAYCLPFEVDPITHEFQPNVTFDDVLDTYIFDREIRLLILNAIERIEVSVRSHWAYELASRHDSHAHLDRSLFDEKHWVNNLSTLKREIDRSQEVFITHFNQTYSDALPPVWVVVEVMSFRSLSSWYSTLKPKGLRTAISSHYQINDDVLASWLHHLSIVRNTCAHHSRLWNKNIKISPKHIARSGHPLKGEIQIRSKKIYNTLVILLYLMDKISPEHQWRSHLRELLCEHSQLLTVMDFPVAWESKILWNR